MLEVFGQKVMVAQPADFLVVGRPCFYRVAVEAMDGDNAGLTGQVRH